MKLFHSRENPLSQFPAERYEPVVRQSICTGERTACMRERQTGRLHEIMLIRTEQELRQFAKDCGVDVSTIRTVY